MSTYCIAAGTFQLLTARSARLSVCPSPRAWQQGVPSDIPHRTVTGPRSRCVSTLHRLDDAASSHRAFAPAPDHFLSICSTRPPSHVLLSPLCSRACVAHVPTHWHVCAQARAHGPHTRTGGHTRRHRLAVVATGGAAGPAGPCCRARPKSTSDGGQRRQRRWLQQIRQQQGSFSLPSPRLRADCPFPLRVTILVHLRVTLRVPLRIPLWFALRVSLQLRVTAFSSGHVEPVFKDGMAIGLQHLLAVAAPLPAALLRKPRVPADLAERPAGRVPGGVRLLRGGDDA